MTYETKLYGSSTSTSVPSPTGRVPNDVLRDMVFQMRTNFVGPMKPQLFLDHFLPCPPSPMPPCPACNLASVQNVEEIEKYNLLAELLQSVAPDLEFVNTSAVPDDACTLIKGWPGLAPDVSVYSRTSSRPRTKVTDFSAMEISVDFKPDAHLDAFNDLWRIQSGDETDFGRFSEDAREIQSNIIVHASAQMHTQLRVFCFTVLICANRARLIRWDHAGAIVTESFDYTLEPDLLAQFFWRYNYLSPSARGVDPSLRFCTDASLAQIARDRLGLPDDADIYEFCVPDDKLGLLGDFDQWGEYHRSAGTSAPRYLAALPSYRPSTPIRFMGDSFPVLEHTTGRVLLLKDRWRYDIGGWEKEGCVYDALQQKNVPFLPVFVQAGDVMQQRTVTTDYIESLSCEDSPCEWLPWSHLTPRRHYRLLLGTVGRMVTEFDSSHQAVTAIWDAIEALQKAFDAGYLHCGLRPAVILIGPDGRGLLTGWEHAIPKDQVEVRSKIEPRRGTRIFMSAALANRLTEIFQLEDDLESCLHILMWAMLYFSPSDLTQDGLRRWKSEVYDRSRRMDADGHFHGGPAKHTWFVCHGYLAPLGRVEFTGRPILNKLYNALLDQFALRYELPLDQISYTLSEFARLETTTSPQLPCDKGLRPCPALLRTADWMLKLGRECLERRDEWPLDDRAEKQLTSPPGDGK